MNTNSLISPFSFKIGHGFDVHRFIAGTHLIIGGVTIPFEFAFEAHSDGDVLIHALCDALLGAAGLPDIGHFFPDSDPKFRGIDSRQLLKKVNNQLITKNWCIGNIDCTIIAQAPKIAPYLLEMRQTIATDLEIAIDQVNIKATTTENLGYIGEKKGIAAHAICLLYLSPSS